MSDLLKAAPIALVDMDGTVVDFDGSMKAELAKLRAPDESPTYDETAYEDVPHISARRRLIKSQPGFWANLPPLKLGFDIVGELRELGFRLHVLTKGPTKTPIAWKEKVEWCQRYLPDVPVTVTGDKSLVYGRVLVDDWPSYFTRWLDWRPRGLVVIPAQPWNASYVEHQNFIRYDGKNIDRVRDRLLEAMNRKPDGE